MIKQIKVNGFDENFAYVVHDYSEAAVVDPSGEIDKVFEYIETKKLEVTKIIITHSHFDHYDQLPKTVAKYPEATMLGHDLAVPDLGRKVEGLKDGDVVAVGTVNLQVIHTPGHTPDSICLYCAQEKSLLTADTLFVAGCGRVTSAKTARELWASLERLMELPMETTIYPGHDYGPTPSSTLAWEKENNRFLRGGFDNFIADRLG